jgi:hypothetical protein
LNADGYSQWWNPVYLGAYGPIGTIYRGFARGNLVYQTTDSRFDIVSIEDPQVPVSVNKILHSSNYEEGAMGVYGQFAYLVEKSSGDVQVYRVWPPEALA